MKTQLLICFATLSITLANSIQAKPVSYLPWEQAENIDRGWLYLADDPAGMPDSAQDSQYTKLTLPHTWNALDSLETSKYRRAPSWYRRYITVTPEELKQRLYLRFGAAAQQAELYVNGKHCLSHKGGYTAFVQELTDLVTNGTNRIDIRVNNAFDKNLIPHSGDFTFYGGLYRSVHLLRGPICGISRTYYASPAIRLWSPQVSEKEATLNASIRLDNHASKPVKLTLWLGITTPNGTDAGAVTTNVIVSTNMLVTLPPIKIAAPRLWSPESPSLYDITIGVSDQHGHELDHATLRYGFRWYRFTPDKGFFLNGKPYRLNGVNRHQDLYHYGNALTQRMHEHDLKLIKSTGANWLRLAHYTQHDCVLDMCDQLGILAWEEIPWVNGTAYTPQFLQNMQSMMTEMVNQHFNHPAIIVWGMANEVWLQKGADGKARQCPMVEKQNNLIHSLDPTRVSGIVFGNTTSASRLGVMAIPDVIGYNLYNGWYGGSPAGFSKRASQLHAMNPNKPMVITEYGAGSDMRIHSLHPRMQDFSEEWQVFFFEQYQDQFKKLPWLSGMTWWAFADFGSASRGNSIPHVNQKGLVTFDRRKKDVFYAARARWQSDAVLHIQSSAWINRTGDATQTVHVITNMRAVELLHNGKSLGTQTTNFNWRVCFVPGANTLQARSNTDYGPRSDFATINWQKSQQRFAVTASGQQDANPIKNIADGNPLTRWSFNGKAVINIDLGHPTLLDGLRFDFYRGNQRKYRFTIKTSTDGKTFSKLFGGESTRKIEDIRFPQTEARYIRIYANGSNKNSWNSYFEVEPIVATKIKNKNLYEKIGAGEL